MHKQIDIQLENPGGERQLDKGASVSEVLYLHVVRGRGTACLLPDSQDTGDTWCVGQAPNEVLEVSDLPAVILCARNLWGHTDEGKARNTLYYEKGLHKASSDDGLQHMLGNYRRMLQRSDILDTAINDLTAWQVVIGFRRKKGLPALHPM